MSDAAANAVIYYHPDGFDTGGRRLMGRQSAGAGFLSGFARHGATDDFVCMARDRKIAQQFAERVRAETGQRTAPPRRIGWIPLDQPARLAETGCLFYPSPTLADLAWQRRRHDQRAWSLCGVTHTTASDTVMEAIGAFATAPLQSWDAVICTSKVVRATVDGLLGEWQDYLSARLGVPAGTAPGTAARLQLPVIPLGVDCDAFRRDEAAGKGLRREHAIPDDAVVAIFLGRLTATAKAHPLPMHRGLAEAARRTGANVHLLLVGWFETEGEREQIERLARDICPEVTVHVLDGRDTAVRRAAWSAADLFTSLSDNIQETFGMTPVEAMAAGLPVVITDWNGYRDTIENGVQGISVPTVMPPPGSGEILAERYRDGSFSYGGYIGRTAQFTAVDPAPVAEAYARLIADAELRRRMGAAGLARARSHYDWSVIIPRYEEVWADLAARRARDGEVAPPVSGRAADPLRDDPFRIFASYPTTPLGPGMTVRRIAPNPTLRSLTRFSINAIAMPLLPDEAGLRAILGRIDADPAPTVGELTAGLTGEAQARALRALAWLAKLGIVRIG